MAHGFDVAGQLKRRLFKLLLLFEFKLMIPATYFPAIDLKWGSGSLHTHTHTHKALWSVMQFMDFPNSSIMVCALGGGSSKKKLCSGGQENVMMGFKGGGRERGIG